MLTKGIVEKIETPYSIKVRLPIYDKASDAKNATKTDDLNTAIICTLPNSANQVAVGDIVIVGFEDNDTSKPIILGQLYKDTESNCNLDIITRLLTTTSTTKLFKDTYIGDVKPQEIEYLKGAKDNLQGQIDLLQQAIEDIRSKLNV